MEKTWDVYVALLADGRFYVGLIPATSESAIWELIESGGSGYTQRVRTVSKLWKENHPTSTRAKRRASQLKRWTHEKKRALMDGR